MVDNIDNLKKLFQESQEELLNSEMSSVLGGAHDEDVCMLNKDCQLSCINGCSQGCKSHCASTKSQGTNRKKCELSCKNGCSSSSSINNN